MSVLFDVRGGSEATVEMSNATARIVLRLLGLESRGYLQGELSVDDFRKRLATVSPERIALAEVLPQTISPNHIDAGTPREWLESRITGLHELMVVADSLGLSIVWE